MRIYFARHGQSHANLRREISNRGLRHGLTRRGREQAASLADHLQGSGITHIYSSPLLRAIETSAILANRLNLDYEVTDALREFDCGIAEGRSDDEAWQLWHGIMDAWVEDQRYEQRIQDGESFDEIRERFIPFIARLTQQYGDSGTRILCIAHGGLYWLMLPLVLKNVDLALMARQSLDYTTCIVCELHQDGLYCLEWNGRTIAVS